MQLLDLHLGKPLTRGALTIFPVWNGLAVERPAHDLCRPRLTVSERAGSPVVAELVVHNGGARPVVVFEGELLEGGHQHRVAARTVVVPAGEALVLDVRCVEQGRWGTGPDRHVPCGRRAPLGVRSRSGRSQGEVWSEVARLEQRYGDSPTSSLLDVTADAADAAARLVAGIAPLPFQTGLLVGIAGHPLLLEVFDCPRSLAAAWPALLQAAALDAVALDVACRAPAPVSPQPTPGRRARRFLERLSGASPYQRREAGLGVQTSAAAPHTDVSVVTLYDALVHAVAVNRRHELVAA
ncbi:MAG: hypothetical protein M3P95_00710 [Actinomycetota bacterium]|nr:hypothetical protein [Actinomycetota bacterium]